MKIKLGESVCHSVRISVYDSLYLSPYILVTSLVRFGVDSYVYTSIWVPINNLTRWEINL